MEADATLENLLQAIFKRFARQNSWDGEAGEITKAARRLAGFMKENNLLARCGGVGRQDEIPDAEASAWTAEILRALDGPVAGSLAVPVKQILKACANPFLGQCRNSFRETGADGVCRRQELSRAKARASGSHCIDCPYWTELAAEPHRDFLRKAWKGSLPELEHNWETFLPEDFRALRQWLAESPE